MNKKTIDLLIIILSSILFHCKEEQAEFFGDMPNDFLIDSLIIQQDLFKNLSIRQVGMDAINIETKDSDLFPFCGTLMVKNDTIFHKQNNETNLYNPYLKLTASKFDTLRINYSPSRSDDVVAMGKMYDPQLKDSLAYFQLIPVRRMAPSGSTFIKYIALKKGLGIRYLTFSNYSNAYTIIIKKYPKVVWSSGQ
jgi:hypothetical protein